MLARLKDKAGLYALLFGCFSGTVHILSAATLPDKVFIFGDSFSNMDTAHVDGNGPTAFSYLAEDLDTPLTDSSDPDPRGKSIDFAVSAAPTGLAEAKYIDGKKYGLGIKNQVQDFAYRTRTGKISFSPSTTLFLLVGGLNDQHSPTEATIGNLKDEIRALAELGAVHIEIALLPESIPAFHEVSVRLNPAIAKIPQELSTELPNLEIRLCRWGLYFDAVDSSPAKFGISTVFYHASQRSPVVEKIVGDKLYLDLLADLSRSDRDDPITASLVPVWTAQQHSEPILPVRDDPAKPAHAKLLFTPSKIYGAHSADGRTKYKEGQDFVVNKTTGTVTLPQTSRIPYRLKSQLTISTSEGDHLFGVKNSTISPGIFFSEGAIYEGFQTYIDYRSSSDAWEGYIPQFSGKQLPRTLALLTKRHNLHLLVIGDSISAGYSSSSYLQVPPHEPNYVARFAAGLQRLYNADIFVNNISVPGWHASEGADRVQASGIASTHPDLTIIAFGMNDVESHDPSAYRISVQSIIHDIRQISPETEFILIAPMMGNKDWVRTPPDQFSLYRDQLVSLAGDGAVMLDMTALWQHVLQRKTFFDITGNGLNHPNDFGHRLYAQALLSLLVDKY